MRIIESRKQALLSFIITTFINITISPNNNHPLLYVDICNWGSMTEPILTPIAENDIYIKPMSVLFHPELTLPPSVTNVDSSIYLTQTLPDVSHVVAYNHNNRISYMKVSLCSRLVIIGRDSSVCLTPLDSNIRLFNDKPNSPLISHSGRVLNADITRDSRMIVSCGTDCQIRVAHVEAFRPIAHYKMHAEPVVSVAWDKRNEFFAGASRDRTISLWSLRSPNVLRLFIGHTLPINKVIFSQDTRNIISCANDLTMRVWDIASGNQTAMFSCGRSPPIALDVSPNNNLVACGCENGNVILWSMEKGVKVWDVNEFGSPVSDLKFTNDGSVLLASSISGALCAWNVHDNNNNSECVLKTDAIASTIDSITGPRDHSRP
ncbi:Transcription initiation factor TFIID subunit 5 [Histomonas meleagridis]|uniref:Transcription initiation factor TFIID subunit 5 n=1 Tax=Histomonas meleagridis TaxID=135588 RepID=UPI00355A2CB3|nr:Transcription initiation factor TFIID subunit 5 [Histomonas meleagridis]KAH0801718.1 Transcription initiation factor TFIID subunit 5 [Histomonas meleagridis]